MVSTLEIAWLAGIIEGEGCIRLCNGKYNHPRILVKMTDRDVVERVHTLMGGGFRECSRPDAKPHWKRQWVADVTGKRAAGVLYTIYTFLGERRRAKAKEVLQAWNQTPIKTGRPWHGHLAKTQCPAGHPYDEDNTLRDKNNWRRCAACHRERERKRRYHN